MTGQGARLMVVGGDGGGGDGGINTQHEGNTLYMCPEGALLLQPEERAGESDAS